MDSIVTFIAYSVVLLLVSMVGAAVPRVRKLKDSQAHLLVALSSGIFIGLLFLLLLPEALHEIEHSGHDMHTAMYCLLGGFVLIMLIEVIIKRLSPTDCYCHSCNDAHSHKITTFSSFIGLSVHAACDGMALAATFLAGAEIGLVATVGMCIHKFVVLFSLSSTMLLTDYCNKHSMMYLGLFSLITPISGLIFFLLFNGIDIHGMTGLPLMFAAGTFMYVALCDLLPEAFHREKQNHKSFALIVLGILLMLVISILFPHTH